MAKVLIVDDDKDISELISLILSKEGIDSLIVNDPMKVISILDKDYFDLILLDIMMPDISGIELCGKIRDKVDAPIIFLSAKNELIDKMLGYEIGGDDYITKPFNNMELVLKIKSHLRLNKRNRNNNGSVIKIGNITINKDTFEVYNGQDRVDLSTREFELLSFLMDNAGLVLSKEQIYESVWGSSYGDLGTVAVNIKSLRDKLNDNNKYIITVWGYGYKFVREIYDEKKED